MLKMRLQNYYRVKEGQTLREIAAAFSVSEGRLIACNRLKEQPFTGQILRIPEERGNLYTVQAGDTKELLCGSEENYRLKNGTDVFYIGMQVLL
ncbi:MAG: LysM peptidoglycan-binding domain-containing protein [Clostridia bacterium]|nr:LysM peptidoglycan-binding domain-containing protein [Clostridia bacterium]